MADIVCIIVCGVVMVTALVILAVVFSKDERKKM